MLRFEDILGHEQIKEYFKSALERHQVSHAYILTGEAGMGRKSLATPSPWRFSAKRAGRSPAASAIPAVSFSAGTIPT